MELCSKSVYCRMWTGDTTFGLLVLLICMPHVDSQKEKPSFLDTCQEVKNGLLSQTSLKDLTTIYEGSREWNLGVICPI